MSIKALPFKNISKCQHFLLRFHPPPPLKQFPSETLFKEII